MSDGRDYKEALNSVLQGAKVGGAVVAEGILAAAGAHPGISDPDSTFSLIDMARGKSEKGKGLGKDDAGPAPRPKGGRSMDQILFEGKGKKGKKSKLAKAALGALAGPALPPVTQLDYQPTAVAFSPVNYAGGRPTRTQAEYAKDLG